MLRKSQEKHRESLSCNDNVHYYDDVGFDPDSYIAIKKIEVEQFNSKELLIYKHKRNQQIFFTLVVFILVVGFVVCSLISSDAADTYTSLIQPLFLVGVGIGIGTIKQSHLTDVLFQRDRKNKADNLNRSEALD